MNHSPRLLVLSLLASSVACATVEAPLSEDLPGERLDFMVVDVDKGDIRYSAAPTENLMVRGRAWGRATDESEAQDRMDTTGFQAHRDGNAAYVVGTATAWGSGTDLDVTGPANVDVLLETRSGTARLSGVTGFHSVRANRIEVWDSMGSFDLQSSGSVEASLLPGPGDTIRIAAEGDVVLSLPPGLDYDLQIWGDPEYQVRVEDLGFGPVFSDAGYFAGVSGPGTTRVDVVVTGGSVDVHRNWTW